MEQNKSNIALLLGDPAGIGPELISKLLKNEMTVARLAVGFSYISK